MITLEEIREKLPEITDEEYAELIKEDTRPEYLNDIEKMAREGIWDIYKGGK